MKPVPSIPAKGPGHEPSITQSTPAQQTVFGWLIEVILYIPKQLWNKFHPSIQVSKTPLDSRQIEFLDPQEDQAHAFLQDQIRLNSKDYNDRLGAAERLLKILSTKPPEDQNEALPKKIAEALTIPPESALEEDEANQALKLLKGLLVLDDAPTEEIAEATLSILNNVLEQDEQDGILNSSCELLEHILEGEDAPASKIIIGLLSKCESQKIINVLFLALEEANLSEEELLVILDALSTQLNASKNNFSFSKKTQALLRVLAKHENAPAEALAERIGEAIQASINHSNRKESDKKNSSVAFYCTLMSEIRVHNSLELTSVLNSLAYVLNRSKNIHDTVAATDALRKIVRTANASDPAMVIDCFEEVLNQFGNSNELISAFLGMFEYITSNPLLAPRIKNLQAVQNILIAAKIAAKGNVQNSGAKAKVYSREAIDAAGKLWVGPKAQHSFYKEITNASGKKATLNQMLSADGKRRYRPPLLKAKTGLNQANFELLEDQYSPAISNYHATAEDR